MAVQNPETQLKKVKKIIAAQRQSAEGAIRKVRKAKGGEFVFAFPSDEQLLEKLGRARSPMITSLSWQTGMKPGFTFIHGVGIYNPDPVTHGNLYTHLFFGPANMLLGPGEALATADARWPQLIEPTIWGLSVGPQSSASVTYRVTVPLVAPGNYAGNSFLYQADLFDVGHIFDRGCIIFQVT